MSLRVRLIVVFFLLSVVPMTALTYYGYRNSVTAVREAAQRETELLAGELKDRMQVVTTQLSAQFSERVERLMSASDAAPPAAAAPAPAVAVRTTSAPTSQQAAEATAANAEAKVADALGDLAMLLNNVQVTGLGRGRGGPGRGRGQGGRAGGFPPPNSGAAPQPPGSGTPQPGQAQTFGGGRRGRGGTDPSNPENRGGAPPDGRAAVVTDGRAGGQPFDGRRGDGGQFGPQPGRGPDPGRQPGESPEPSSANDRDRITIDLMPVRQQLLEQYGSREEIGRMSEADRQRIMDEVNQRMLGVQMGIQLGTAEAQKRIADVQRAATEAAATEAAASARATSGAPRPPAAPAAPTPPKAAAPAPAAPAVAGSIQRRATLSGSRLDVTMVRNGEVLQQANAEVNLPVLLRTVFSSTRRERGEVPFAVAADGRLYTPTDTDRQTVTSLGDAVVKPDAPAGTAMVRDWIVVTTPDPTGSGLKFGIARPVGESLRSLWRSTAINASIGLAFILLALIGIVPLSSRLTRNLSTLNDGVRRIADGDYRARVNVKSADEIGQLARAFNQMAADVEEHQRAAVGQERIRRELELGRQIQHDMLPRVPLRLGLTEVKGVSVPAREVGGDFFNYFQVPNGQIALLMGDVSGKGVGAALLMANIQASLRTRLALGQDLASLAREIDKEVESSTPGAVYATLFVAMLDVDSHVLRYVNAGHHAQYVLRGDGSLEGMPSSGLPIGLLAGHGYTERHVSLAAGDELFFYTDGCVETENEQDEMFGSERLEALLRSVARSGADAVLAAVEDEVSHFRGTREPFDDATMMAVKVG